MNSTAEPGPSLQTAQILGEGTPDLSRRELGRWTWRQLTSMRMALLLLLLLALGAVPGYSSRSAVWTLVRWRGSG